MTVLVPIMMFGWIPLTILFFLRLSPQKAILFSVIGGFLLLPVVSYDFPGIPSYSKETAISISILLGSMFSNQRNNYSLKLRSYDLFMLMWCFVSPIITSLSNDLGLYDGLSNLVKNYLMWGVFYFFGRKYFNKESFLRDLSLGIIIGGIIYIPLILYEVRMSPRLSRIIYGFFAHDWRQHIRYGGYRPIVFMQHGLVVSLWMASTFIVSFWLWRNKTIRHIKGVPMWLIVVFLFIVTIICKSANAWIFLFLGITSWVVFKKLRSTKFLRFLLLLIPFYLYVRATNIITLEFIESNLLWLFDEERIYSLVFRLRQEDLYSQKALEHFLFGWGGYSRGNPIDPNTGRMLRIVDSLWLIAYSGYGIFGLISLFGSMLIGPILVLKEYLFIKKENLENSSLFIIDSIVLSLIVIFFMIDSLVNGMVNPIYVLCAGVLVSYYEATKKRILL